MLIIFIAEANISILVNTIYGIFITNCPLHITILLKYKCKKDYTQKDPTITKHRSRENAKCLFNCIATTRLIHDLQPFTDHHLTLSQEHISTQVISIRHTIATQLV